MMIKQKEYVTKVVGLVDLYFTNKCVPISKALNTLIKCIVDTGEALYTCVLSSPTGPVGCHPLNFLIKSRFNVCFVCLVALRPKSTAMVMAGRSVHLTTLFSGQY